MSDADASPPPDASPSPDAPSPEAVKTVIDKVAPMLGKKLFVCITNFVEGQSMSELFDLLPAHLDHQVQLEKDGSMFGAGPLRDPDAPPAPTKGLIIVRADSAEEARAIFDADPIHAAGVRDYELYEWTLNEGRITLTLDFSDQTVRFD